MFDVFGDAQERGYLRNVAGTNDMALVKRLEHRSFLANVDTALAELSRKKEITYPDVLHTHRTLFASVYPTWAGEDRRLHAPHFAITKGGRDIFAYPQDVQSAMEYGLRQAQDGSYMARRPGDVMGIFAYAHPFLDGNGRTIMTIHAELAARAGIRIEWEGTSKVDYLAALTGELESPGTGVLDAYLARYVRRHAGRRPMADSLKQMPASEPPILPPPRHRVDPFK